MGLFAPEDRLLILIVETTKHRLLLSVSLTAWDTSPYDGSDQKEQGGRGKGRNLGQTHDILIQSLTTKKRREGRGMKRRGED